VWLGTPGQMWLWVSLIGIGGSRLYFFCFRCARILSPRGDGTFAS